MKSNRRLKITFSLILTLCLSFGNLSLVGATGLAGDGYEPNNTLDQAKTISVNSQITASVNPVGDADVYKFTIPADGTVNFTLTSLADMDGVMALVNAEEQIFAVMDDTSEGEQEFLSRQLKAGTYYVVVGEYNDNASTGTYSLSLSYNGQVFDALEPNDDPLQAPEIEFNKDVKAKINPAGDEDFYKLNITDSEMVTITLSSPAEMDGVLVVLDEQGNPVYTKDEGIEGEVEKIQEYFTPGLYYLYIADHAANQHNQEYTIRVNLGLPGQMNINYELANFLRLPFSVTDAVADPDPDRPILYITDQGSNKLYAVNYLTGEVKSTSFDYVPESIEIGKGQYSDEIYVALLHGEHDSYWWGENQSGTIAIVDKETLFVKDKFNVGIDPYDLVAGRDGHIYISPGSGQWADFVVYDRASKAETYRGSLRQKTIIKMHPTEAKIFGTSTDISPRDFAFTKIASPGILGTSKDSPYHGDYELTTNFELDPTGKQLFNGSGHIFEAYGELNHEYKLNSAFSDIAFEPDLSMFYITPSEISNYGVWQGAAPANMKAIYIYDGSSYELIGSLDLKGYGKRVFERSNQIVALIEPETKTSSYKTGIQVFSAGPKPSITSPENNLETTKDDTISESYHNFKDMTGEHWAKEEVDYLANSGVVNGYPDGTFRPLNEISRAQAIKMIVEALDLELVNDGYEFTDVNKNSWYYPYIATAKKHGIINGYLDGSLRPNEGVTRAQMAKMITIAFEFNENNVALNFTDTSEHWAEDYINKLATEGITTGYLDNTFRPDEVTTRAHMAAFLARTMEPSFRQGY